MKTDYISSLLVTPHITMNYCFNCRSINFMDFVYLENKSIVNAAEKKYVLFTKYGDLLLSKN